MPERRPSRRRLLAFAPAAALLFALPVHAGNAPVRVVYQVNEGAEQASRAIINITNHLNAEAGVKIVVVAFGKGIDFLLDDAKDVHGNPFDAAVAGLTQRGVEFRICRNTLVARGIDDRKVNPEVRIVPSGVAEIARLQFREHYAYLRP